MYLGKTLKLAKIGRLGYFSQGKAGYYSHSMEPTQPLKRQPVWTTADEAMECVKSYDTVFLSGGIATPMTLINAMVCHAQKKTLTNIGVVHLLTEGCAPFAETQNSSIFRSCSLFVGANVREAVANGRADAVPIASYDIPFMFSNKLIEPDVSLVHVSPADEHGFCSLGTSVDCVRAALINSKLIIAQVNKRMPRTFGDSLVHQSHFDYAVYVDEPLQNIKSTKLSDSEITIGKLIAEHLIHDGATLHFGVGNIPNAVMMALKSHKNLGIHTEILSANEYLTDLIVCGTVTNSYKKANVGRIVASTIIGNDLVFSLTNNNPYIEMKTLDYTNSIAVISKQPKMTSVNTAIEIDLTGQVCSDSMGTMIYSGVGGQSDFIKGSALGMDGNGKPIIAMTSINANGESRIKSCLTPGAGVVTSRADVNYVVTEFGIACLHGKNFRQRAYDLIEIAHPDFRCALEKAAHQRLKTSPKP